MYMQVHVGRWVNFIFTAQNVYAVDGPDLLLVQLAALAI